MNPKFLNLESQVDLLSVSGAMDFSCFLVLVESLSNFWANNGEVRKNANKQVNHKIE